MSTLIPYRHNNHLSRPDAMSFMDDFFRPFLAWTTSPARSAWT